MNTPQSISKGDFQSFKSYFLTLLKKIGKENLSQIVKDLRLFTEWLNFFKEGRQGENDEDNNTTEIADYIKKFRYFTSDVLPVLLNSVLQKNTFDWSKPDSFLDVTNFLETACDFIAGNMDENVYESFEALMNSRQNLYLKVCLDRETKEKEAVVNVSNSKTQDLHLDKYSDAQSSSQVNENLPPSHTTTLVVDDELQLTIWDSLQPDSCIDAWNEKSLKWEIAIVESVTANDILVVWPNDERTVIKNYDYHKIAEFGTKTGIDNGLSKAEPIISDINGALKVEALNQNNGIEDWKKGLNVGDLLDFCVVEFGEQWFQGCILEIIISDDKSALSDDSGQRNDKESDATIVTNDVNDLTCDENAESKSADNHTKLEVTNNNDEGHSIVFVRVAAIGLSDSYDKWINVSDDTNKIAPLNTRSSGKRGKGPTRDEIQFAAKRRLRAENCTNQWDFQSSVFEITDFFKNLVMIFKTKNGFDKIKHTFNKVKVETNQIDDNLQGKQKSWIFLYKPLVAGIAHLDCMLLKSDLSDLIPTVLESINAILLGMNFADIRQMTNDVLNSIFDSLEVLAYSHYGYNKDAGIILENLKLNVALRDLRCPYLNRRLGGMKLLADILKRAECSRQCPTGLEIIRTGGNETSFTLPYLIQCSYRVVPVFYFLTVETICEEINKTHIFVDIYQDKNTHSSLLERTPYILSVLTKQSCLGEDLIVAVWRSAFLDKKHEALVSLTTIISSIDDSSERLLYYIYTLCEDKFAKILPMISEQSVLQNLIDTYASLAQRSKIILFGKSYIILL